MAARDGQKASRWVESDRTVKRIWHEGGGTRLRPLSNALSKPKKTDEQNDSPTSSSLKNATASQSQSQSESPSKTKSKLKPPSKPQSKSSGRSIQSFFNTATQKQQGLQYLASPEKLAALHDEIEVIEDDTDEGRAGEQASQTTLSRGSSTALAARKRKHRQAHGFESPPEPSRHASQKFRKIENGDKAPPVAKIDSNQNPWTEQFAPTDLSELAVHKRKVADVRNWLELFYQGRRSKVLVLKGAAGTGKTTTVRLLAKEMGIGLINWNESLALENSVGGVMTSTARFADFVARAGQANGLALSGVTVGTNSSSSESQNSNMQSGRQALLVEEFPNTFSRISTALQSFRTTLEQYVMSTAPAGMLPVPIIMVISESLLSTNTASADSFTAHRLLGPELVTNPYINTIEFNAIAPTILTKALEHIVVKEARKSGRRRTPGPQVLKRLAESGDIRSAVSSLQFLCVRGDEGDTWSSKVAFTKSKQPRAPPPSTKAEQEALKLISNRESSLGIFHAVGKVVYNKRIESSTAALVPQPPPWLSQHNRTKAAETESSTLIDELGTDTSTFIAALHENYALSCAAPTIEQKLDSLHGCMQNLSDSDLLSLDRFSFGTRAFSGSATDTLRQDEMCFQVAVRGLLFSLPHPVHRSEAASGKRADAHRMLYPASLRLWRKKEEVETTLDALFIGKYALGASLAAAGAKDAHPGHSNGIESRKQRSFGGLQKQATDTSDFDEAAPRLSAQAKNEMLLDRLPYMAQILSGPRTSAVPQELRDQIITLTKMDGVVLPSDDGDAEPPDVAEGVVSGEEWSTDRPCADAKGFGTSSTKAQTPSRPAIILKDVTTPVERRVQSLILEDDDIED